MRSRTAIHTPPRRILHAALALVGALALGAPTAGAQQGTRLRDRDADGMRMDTTFAFAQGGALEVDLPHGRGADVVVTGWARNEVQVVGETSRGMLSVDVSGGRLVEVGTRGDRGPAEVERLEIRVPTGTRVSIDNGSGDITVRATRGAIDATSFNGDITVEDIADRCELKTFNGDVDATRVNARTLISASNGDVRLDDAQGDLDVNTLNGDIEFRRIASPRVRAKTMSGEISFEGALDPRGDYDFNAFSGAIDLVIPRNTGATLTVSTFSGSVDSPDFPLTLKPGTSQKKGQTMTFDLGNGGARISLESFSGEITIREARPVPRD